MGQKTGNRVFRFEKDIRVAGRGNCVGKIENEGPLSGTFDHVIPDEYYGKQTFEQAETEFQKTALETAAGRAGLPVRELGLIAGGDLLNQCIASGYCVRNNGVPFWGLYGACSTMALSILTAAIAVETGMARHAAALTSSHFCSAERQYRTPLEYGGQRPPSAQRTVTAAACLILAKEGAVRVEQAMLGRVVDFNVTDVFHMGGAMAPAAADTLAAFFADTGTAPADFDLIITGDLGVYGSAILRDLMNQRGIVLGERYADCGVMIFDGARQDTHAGGSGCGCSGAVLTARVLPEMEKGTLRNVLFCATGALMSPTSVMQSQSIPAVAHLIHFTN